MHGSHAAIIAAEQRRKELEKQHNEEEMSNYQSDDLDQYEFKIVRTSTRRFHRPEVFQQLLEEEAQAGWDLLEKLDDQRVRFKRSKDMRRKDATLPPGVDPYRTQFGNDVERRTRVAAIGVALLVFCGGFVFFTGGMNSSYNIPKSIPMIMVIVGILMTAIAAATSAARNR